MTTSLENPKDLETCILEMLGLWWSKGSFPYLQTLFPNEVLAPNLHMNFLSAYFILP